MVRDWLTMTFTRSLSNLHLRQDHRRHHHHRHHLRQDRLRFRSVANAIRAGIVVDRSHFDDLYPRGAMLAPVLAMALCPSICLSDRLSQVGVLSKRLDESGWVSVWELPSTYPTLCFIEIQVPLKIRVLFSGTLLQSLDLENFATAYRSSKLGINLARERWTLRA